MPISTEHLQHTACIHRTGCVQQDICVAAQRCLAPSFVPPWPQQPSGKVPGMFMSTEADTERWLEYRQQVQTAAIARIRLARRKIEALATECATCHGKRCANCEDIWQIIDQLEVPAWMR